MRPSDLSGPTSASKQTRLPVVLLALLALVVCSLSLAASARADGAPPVASPFGSSLDRSQLIVTFKQTSGAAAVSSTLADAGATKIGTIAHTAATIVAVPDLGADAVLATLRSDPDVASVRVDPVVQLTLSPNDPQFHYPFNPCQSSLGCWPYSELNLPAAWDTTTGSASVTVAVIDTGVAPSHVDLSGAVLPGWNFVAGNANAADDNGHGTEVAGMIAARGNNGIGVVGSCWSCKILPVKVLSASGSGYASAVANGIT